MAGSINKVILVGNLGNDPEIRSTQDGREIANISLATTDSWKDKNTGEKRDKTEWHRVVIFSPGLVNLAKNYLRKGAKIYLEGSLQTRKWQDPSSGQDKYSTEVVLQVYNSSLVMLDSRSSNNSSPSYGDSNNYNSNNSNNSQNNQSNSNQSNNNNFAVEELDDDIPF